MPHRLLSKTDSFTLLLFNPNLPVCCCCCWCLASDDNGQYEVRCRSLIHVNIPQEEMENQGKPKKRNLRTYVYISWSNFFFFFAFAQILFYPTAIGSEPQDPTLDSSAHWRRVMQGHAAVGSRMYTARGLSFFLVCLSDGPWNRPSSWYSTPTGFCGRAHHSVYRNKIACTLIPHPNVLVYFGKERYYLVQKT